MTLTKQDLFAIRGVVREEIKKEVSPIKKSLVKIEKKFDELFDFLDEKYLEVKKDVRKIQNHLHLPISDF